MLRSFDLVAFDADDTLWHSEDGFHATEMKFVELVSPYAPQGVDVKAALTATERKNLSVTGYGVKAFGLSAVEAAITVTGGAIPSSVIAEIVEAIHALLTRPVQLLDDVPEVLSAVGAHRPLALITKGDLIHQTHKVETSGLAHHFRHVEIVLEKDPATYDRVFRSIGVAPERVCMVGNSVRSDVLPVISLGGTAVHIPYPLLWELEHVDPSTYPPDHFVALTSIRELTTWLGVEP